MALRATLAWLCSIAVLYSCVAQDEASALQCSSHTELLEHLKVAVQCADSPPSDGSVQQTAALLLHLRNLTASLHRDQLRDCQDAEPRKCPNAEVPRNGGLACVTVDKKRYCKPLCNHGYDFGFIRRSRLFDECSQQTRYEWTSQYVGGNTLAVCNEATSQVSGASSAYFPKDQDCLTVKSSSQLTNGTIEEFVAELKNQGIEGEPQYACLVCG